MAKIKEDIAYVIPMFDFEIPNVEDKTFMDCMRFSFPADTDKRKIKREMYKVARVLGVCPRKLFKEMGFKELL